MKRTAKVLCLEGKFQGSFHEYLPFTEEHVLHLRYFTHDKTC